MIFFLAALLTNLVGCFSIVHEVSKQHIVHCAIHCDGFSAVKSAGIDLLSKELTCTCTDRRRLRLEPEGEAEELEDFEDI